MAYVTVAQLRAEGLTVAMVSDARAAILIARWSEWIDRRCGQWFESKAVDLYFDGSGGKMVHFQVPIITCTSLYLNESTSVLDPTYYAVYNKRGGTEGNDDRKNPKIVLKPQNVVSIFSTGYYNDFIFEPGPRNQRFIGTMGYTESDGTTPKMIQWALTTIIVNNYKLAIPEAGPIPDAVAPGVIKSELTDGHQIVYGLVGEYSRDSLEARPTVGSVLKAYRTPIRIRAVGVSYNYGPGS